MTNFNRNNAQKRGSAWDIKFPKTFEEGYLELMRLKIKKFWDRIEPVEDRKPIDNFLRDFISDEYDGDTHVKIQRLYKKWCILLYKNSLSDDKFKTVSDVMLILTGGQQIGKSRFINNLLPLELCITYHSLPDKSFLREFNQALLTKLLIHFDDAIPMGINRSSHWEKLKELISSPYAVWTPKYTNEFIAEKRIASYVATTRETHFLPEDEGLHRRVLVVKVRRYDPELLPSPEFFWGYIKHLAHQDPYYDWNMWKWEEKDFFAELAKQHIKT